VYGTTQKLQNLSQPSWMVRKAVTPCDAAALGRKSNFCSAGKSVSMTSQPARAARATISGSR
jgi:hypothetical protein